MTLHIMKKSLVVSIFFPILASAAFADHTKTVVTPPVITQGKFYIGGFGGGGSSNQFHVSQLGTAFYTEASGGPLAVNAFGHASDESAWLAGAQVGYRAQGVALPSTDWMLGPAIELEGFYLGHHSFNADLTNNTDRLDEHDFQVTYSMQRSVFLTNAVLSLDNPCILFHPYIGAGFGGALVNVTNANALQTAPPENGINHFNSNTRDIDPTFAGQVKVGLSYDINNYVTVFAEYRWLYLSSTHFLFGSTVYPTHVATSSWQVKMDPQQMNMGTAGIRFNL